MKKIILAVAVAAVVIVAVAASVASAGGPPARSQVRTATLVVTLPTIPGNSHTFTITSACGSFTGNGSGTVAAGSPNETITGSLSDNNLTFTSTYGANFAPGYTWSYDGGLSGGNMHDSFGTTLPVTIQLLNVTDSSFKNHGEYVSSMGGGDDAAHSCIGMPVH